MILILKFFRRLGVRCRLHGFTIEKSLQKGAITGIAYKLAPESVVHSWVEIEFEGIWYNLEGFIIDKTYLEGIQNKFDNHEGKFSGYWIGVDSLHNQNINWN